MVFQSRKNGVKSSLNFERSQLSPWAKIKKSEAAIRRSTLPLSFCENRLCLSQLIKKLNSTERGALFRHFCVSKVISTAHAHKSGVIFSSFPRAFKQKIKALRPKMTKIASRGYLQGGISLQQRRPKAPTYDCQTKKDSKATLFFQSRKNGVKSSLNFERSQLSPWAKIKKSEAGIRRSTLPLSFCENRLCLSQLIKKLNSTERGALFRHFCVSKVISTAHAHKSGVIFSFFPRAFKQKIKALRPKMTKIASRGYLQGGISLQQRRPKAPTDDCQKKRTRKPLFSYAFR